VAASVVLAIGGPGFSAEQTEEFLRGLKERGLNELALDYLDRMKSSSLADEKFRQAIPYHRGMVLLDQSRRTVDPEVRTRLLDEARTQLEQFSQANPQNVKGADAQLELGTMQVERGQQLVAQAGTLPQQPAYDAERRKLSQEARRQFAAARQTFESAAAIYAAELEKLPPAASSATNADSEQGNRQEYRARVAQLRFLAAQTDFEIAQSYPPDDEQFRTLHESTARALATLYDEFARSGPTSLIGLYARLYEGRCYQALGQLPMALGCFKDIIDDTSSVLPPFRKLIAAAAHRKAETLMAQNKIDDAIALCRLCLQEATADEEKQPEWLAVRYRLAQSLEKQITTLPAGSPERRKMLVEVREAYRTVAASPNEFQAAARTAMAAVSRENSETPETFQAAYDLGKDALASYNAAKLALPTAQENNPEAVGDLEIQMEQGKQDARRYFDSAISLVEDDTDPVLVNEVRYFLCWLYWDAQDYYRAAVLGEFLARRFPDHPAARSAAKIAMASFERLYRQAADSAASVAADTEFEARRMAQVAEFIARRWPGTEDADAAFGVLVSYAIRSNEIAEAEKLLADASPESRPRLELQLGSAMWGRFLELSQTKGPLPTGTDLEQLKQSAVGYLRTGFDSARAANDITDQAATAGLYLVQALLSDGQYEQAIELLEDAEVGPLTLVSAQHPTASRPAYVIEALKAALRAYVLVSPPREENAVATMQSLETAIQSAGSGTADAADQLTQIYISLGVALQEQVDKLLSAGQHEEAQRVTDAILQFLEQIRTSQSEINWPTRAWLAQTYYNLGTGERAGAPAPSAAADGRPPADPVPATGPAREHLIKARDTYRQMLAAANTDPKLAPNANAVLAVRMQLGRCLRALGEYEHALNTFSSILKEKEASLTVQQAAAYTYQSRGQAEGPQWFERAIHGGHKLRSTGQNRIWGWLKISQVAARAARTNQKYRDTFFEARYNVSRCRYLAAMKNSGRARQDDLAKAKQSINSMLQLYPKMGGEHWRSQFDALLKEIQKASGEEPIGLTERRTATARES
jgi:tetratricopeptide (TPR) repeat protein